MKTKLALSAFVSGLVFVGGLAASVITFPDGQEAYAADGSIAWQKEMAKAQAEAKSQSKFVFADVYTDWCGWCKVMDKNTFANDDIINYINKNYYPVKFNAETKDNIEFNNKVYSYVGSKGRGYNEFALLLTGGRLSYPTVVFIDEELNVIQPIQGYQEPKDFYKIMRFFGEDHYKKTPWNVFVQNYSKM